MHSGFLAPRHRVGWSTVLWFLFVTVGLAAEARNPDPDLGAPFTNRARPELGRPEAPVVVIEFTDFRCYHCRRFHERVFPRLREKFVAPGLVRYVTMHLALETDARSALPLAAARAALEQGGYWAMREQLFAHARELPQVMYERLATRAGLDGSRLAQDMKSPVVEAAIAADRREAAAAGVGTTPYFLIRKRDATGRWLEARVDGYEDWLFFERTLNRTLTGD